MKKKRGNCYVASEALYHLLGGPNSSYSPMHMKYKGESHWFLMHRSGFIIDPTKSQFKKPIVNYSSAKGKGFLTKEPSKRAKELMEKILWQQK